MVSDKLYRYLSAVGGRSVSSELAESPNLSPHDIVNRLFSKQHFQATRDSPGQETDHPEGLDPDLERALKCGNWGGRKPSDLFLKCYSDALAALENHPLAGIVSPNLMGTHGVVPLTIISTLHDINKHMANCIVRAENEVFLATNFWIHSDASIIITNALRELSKRAGERGDKVVVKIIYDRGSPKQLLENHQHVPPKEYTGDKIQLPSPDEVPNLDMEVVNYHRPLLGTFHAKLCVIDRTIGLLQSNNIQDNDNLEMMVHMEGPIVDTLYDMLLISWDKQFHTALPMISSPAAHRPISTWTKSTSEEQMANTTASGSVRREIEILTESTSSNPLYDADMVEEARRVNSQLEARPNESRRDATTRHLNKRTLDHNQDAVNISKMPQPDGPEISEENKMAPYIVLQRHEPVPMALVAREPNGTPGNSNYPVPQNAAWLAAINNASENIFIQTPNMNAKPLLEPLLNAARRGVIVTAYVTLGYNDAGELLPGQNGTNEMIAHRLYSSLSTDEEKSRLRIHNYTAKDRKSPVHNKFKYRSSHVKLMIVDETVAIQGNGNLDTQSFFHSTEVNVMIDSPLICKTWRDAIDRNQNTSQFGLVSSQDGCWHHPETGEIAEGTIGFDPGRFSWAKGIVGAVQRVRGAGGF